MAAPVPVYQVLLRLGCGGLEKMVVHLSRSLDPTRFQVTVCCLEDPGELAKELEGTRIPVVSLEKKGFEPKAFVRLAQRLRRERVQIVHTHNPAAHFYGAIGARIAAVPAVVHTRHGPNDDDRHSPLFRGRWVWSLTDAVVTVSQDTTASFLQHNRIARRKVTAIANGVPMPAVMPPDRAAVRQELGIPAPGYVVGIVARLAPEKEHRTLLSAFARVRPLIPAAHLLIVGDGPLRSVLEQQAEDEGIAPYVHFAGFRPDVHRMLAAMDVFVLCSAFEGTSLTLLEAMGAYVPIVATAVGGNPEVLGGPENGCLVPARDVQALAKALVDGYSDRAAASAAAERAHCRMRDQYSVERMAHQYEQLYEQLLGSRQKARWPAGKFPSTEPGK